MSGECKTIKLECSNCGGTMEVPADSGEVICPYCGAKEKILDSDAVAVQKIKSSTYKELEYAKMENEKENRIEQERKEAQKDYRKSFLCKATIVVGVICIIAIFSTFKSGHILAGLIAAVQTGLFGASWLMGMQIIKEKKHYLHIALAILGFLLIIPFSVSAGTEKSEKLHWPETGLAAAIPDPGAKYGSIIVNDDECLDVTVEKYTEEKYEKYLQSCIDMGYSEGSERTGGIYRAFDAEGRELTLVFYSDSMSIMLNAPIPMGELKWPDSEIAGMLPVPKSGAGKIEKESAQELRAYVGKTSADDFAEYAEAVKAAGFEVNYEKGDMYYQAEHADGYQVSLKYEKNQIMYIRLEKLNTEPEEEKMPAAEAEDESAPEPESEKPEASAARTDGIRPEFKEAMDRYEEFYDEYAELVKKYSEDASNIALLAQYGEMCAKALEMDKSFAKWEDEELNNEELKYYAEVNTRVAKKLLDISNMVGSM